MNKEIEAVYEAILSHELVPALGCTEPIAIAFAAAWARSVLGAEPTHMKVYCSGNIIKNVKSVIVPHSGGRRGIEMAALLGCVGGDASRQYEVLSGVEEKHVQKAVALLEQGICKTYYSEGKDNLYIRIEMYSETDSVSVTVEREHTNIVQIIRNGKILSEKGESGSTAAAAPDKSVLNVRDIIRYAESTDLSQLRDLLSRQISMNSRISEEGLKGGFGAEVGRLIMQMEGDQVEGRAIARAAAGSDARMNGCALPVVINSGSGNQGMTITLPVCEYAQHWKLEEDTLLRALIIANLISVHIKHHIGNLSAFCGAVNAACGAACGIAWMDGCTCEQIAMTITNTLCNVGGIVCDGAKSSCAAKIASSVRAGILGYRMAKAGKCFLPGEGLTAENIEKTIDNIGRMGKIGMRETDQEILKMMVQA